jgi:GT2 family glycosyltransferase
MSRTTAVLVTYQSAGVIGHAVDSCIANGLNVVVVDNASTDGSAAEAKAHGAAVIANPENRGFAAAVNQGIQAASGPFVLLLNPDAEICCGVEALEAACDSTVYAASAGKLLDAHGAYQRGFSVRRFPTPLTLAFEVLGINRVWRGNPVNRRYRCLDMAENTAADVDQPAGAFLLLRRDVWEQLGGLDERFHPVWFEDVDYCCRLAAQGYKVRYVPAATAIHAGGHSAKQLDLGSRELYWYGSLLEYAAKHYSRPAHAALSLSVIVGGVLRLLSGIAKQFSLRPFGIYAKVIRLACRSMLFGGGGGKRKTSGSINRTQMHVL